MHTFIVKQRPNSYNSNIGKKKEKYTASIQTAFKSFYSTHDTLTTDLYGILYYFYKRNLDLDTDNLSKPVWDGLVNFLYQDDSQLRLRIAGSFDISKTDFNVLDMSGLNGNVLKELLDAFDTEDHILYIECGNFHHSMVKFNLSNNGN